MKNILIIGATGDVGQGITARVMQHGHRVIAAGRSADRLAAIKTRFANLGTLETAVGSVADRSAASSLLAAVQKLAARIDVVITSVNGPMAEARLDDMPADTLMTILQNNVLTHLIAAQTFIPALQVGGTYLSIGGGMADLVVPGRGAISMCQAAQRMMFKVLAEEQSNRHVRIQELMLYSMIATEKNRAQADPRWITDDEVGRHVVAVLDNPEWFSEPVLTLKSRKQIGLQPSV